MYSTRTETAMDSRPRMDIKQNAPVESAPVERRRDLLGVQRRFDAQQFDSRAGERPVELKCSLRPPVFSRSKTGEKIETKFISNISWM